MNTATKPSLAMELRQLLIPWSFSLLLPIPILLAGGDSQNSDIATLYLALGAAWLATEAFRPDRLPESALQWRRRISTLLIYLVTNAMVFSFFGWSADVQSNIPLPVLAALGIAPSLGLMPWLTLHLRQPYAAIVLGALTVGLIKIGACVVARLVYGADYIAQGYVSADWQTAKLMISLMWVGTLLVSAFALVACHRQFAIRHSDG